MLFKTGYISISRSKQYLKLSQKGFDYLADQGYAYDTAAKRAYVGSPTLRRRLEVSEIMLTALRAGIDVLRDHVDALRDQPVFYPAFDLRTGDINVMGNANCAGFGHWGNKAYMLHYVSPESCGMYLINELGILHKLSSVFAPNLSTPTAMILAGPSYQRVYEQLHDTKLTKRHGSRGFTDFSEIYRRADLPIHLLSNDETGAMQLALMRYPDYNEKIARVAFGKQWNPHDSQIREADGSVGGNPLVIASDMNIQRVGRVCAAARRFGKTKVMIAAFQSQMEGLLFQVFPPDGVITHLCIEQQVLDAAFSTFSLYAPGMDKGDTGHA